MLQSDILQWRKTLALQLLDYPYLHISMVLSDKAIQTIKSKIRCLGVNEEEIKTILSTYGYHFPTCMLTPYIPELVKCIADSLVRSQPPAQLAQAFAAAIQRPPINPPQVQSVSHLIQKSSASQPPIQRLPIPKPSPHVPLAELNR